MQCTTPTKQTCSVRSPSCKDLRTSSINHSQSILNTFFVRDAVYKLSFWVFRAQQQKANSPSRRMTTDAIWAQEGNNFLHPRTRTSPLHETHQWSCRIQLAPWPGSGFSAVSNLPPWHSATGCRWKQKNCILNFLTLLVSVDFTSVARKPLHCVSNNKSCSLQFFKSSHKLHKHRMPSSQSSKR